MKSSQTLNETQRIEELDAAQPGFAAAWTQTKSKLVKFGGKDVVFETENLKMLERLAEGGEIEQPRSVHVQRMERNQGHRNSLMCWAQTLGTEKVWSGYALSTDGVWRQHSWARDERGIIETTEVRVAYFGVELSFKECARMLAAEVHPLDAPQEFQQTDFWRGVTEVLLAGASEES